MCGLFQLKSVSFLLAMTDCFKNISYKNQPVHLSPQFYMVWTAPYCNVKTPCKAKLTVKSTSAWINVNLCRLDLTWLDIRCGWQIFIMSAKARFFNTNTESSLLLLAGRPCLHLASIIHISVSPVSLTKHESISITIMLQVRLRAFTISFCREISFQLEHFSTNFHCSDAA